MSPTTRPSAGAPRPGSPPPASRLAGLGGFHVLEHAGRQGWYWDRTNCCLWYRRGRGRLCDDCSLEPEPPSARAAAAQLKDTAS